MTIRDIRPAIWRRLQVPSEATLLELHRVLQRAFSWDDSHLHEFEGGSSRTGRVRYGIPEPDDFMTSVPVWSYEDFVAALTDPDDEEHEERREWAGDFDLEAFDVAKVDAAVRAAFASR